MGQALGWSNSMLGEGWASNFFLGIRVIFRGGEHTIQFVDDVS